MVHDYAAGLLLINRRFPGLFFPFDHHEYILIRFFHEELLAGVLFQVFLVFQAILFNHFIYALDVFSNLFSLIEFKKGNAFISGNGFIPLP